MPRPANLFEAETDQAASFFSDAQFEARVRSTAVLRLAQRDAEGVGFSKREVELTDALVGAIYGAASVEEWSRADGTDPRVARMAFLIQRELIGAMHKTTGRPQVKEK